jgi:hypothetical protein
MLNLSKPLSFHDFGDFSNSDLIKKIHNYCKRGAPMHPESLKAVVLKLTYLSRDLNLKQEERDTSAELANDLANAALKSYGKNSEFCMDLLHSIRAIVGGSHS